MGFFSLCFAVSFPLDILVFECTIYIKMRSCIELLNLIFCKIISDNGYLFRIRMLQVKWNCLKS